MDKFKNCACLKEAQAQLEAMYKEGSDAWGEDIWCDIIAAKNTLAQVNMDIVYLQFEEDNAVALASLEELSEHCCENCGSHTWGAGPMDDGYIYCKKDNSQHYRSCFCTLWEPEKRKHGP